MKNNFENFEKENTPEYYLNNVVDKFVAKVHLEKDVLEHLSIMQFAPSGFFEEENIRGIIENFLESKISPNEKMLTIFVNGKESDVDKTSPIINDYKMKNEEENITLLKHTWNNDAPVSMGLIRAIPVEFIKRYLEKENIKINPIIVSNDADSVRFSENYLENLVRDLGENEFGGSVSRFELSGTNFLYDLNIILGEIDRSIRSFGLEEEVSFKRGYIYPGGSNMAFRLDDYPGYDLTKNKGEDTDILIKLDDSGAKFKYLNNSKVYTNPRRIINTFNNKGFFHESWKNWENTGDVGRERGELENRDYSLEEVVNYLNEYFSNRLMYLYRKNYHKNNISDFAKYSNNYIEKVLRYLKIFLKSASMQIPEYSLGKINLSDIESKDVESRLKEHEFIEIV
ncbi:MAG: hypothetical protein WDZ80_00460 [Candidatus Paceibacterota bacterium]